MVKPSYFKEAFFLCLFTLTLGLSPAQAQSQAPATEIDKAKVEQLVSTLKNEEDRTAFIENLETLLAQEAQSEALSSSETIADMHALYATDLKHKAEKLATTAKTALHNIQSSDTTVSINFATVSTVLGTAFLAILIAYIARFLLIKPYHYLRKTRDVGLVGKVFYNTLTLCLDCVPLAALYLSGMSLSPLLNGSESAQTYSISLLTALSYGYICMMVLRFIFSPMASHLRLLSTSNKSASYICSFLGLLLYVAFVGIGLIQTGQVEQDLTPALAVIGLDILALLLGCLAFLGLWSQKAKISKFFAGKPPHATLRLSFSKAWLFLSAIYLILLEASFILNLSTAFTLLWQGAVVLALTILLAKILSYGITSYLTKLSNKIKLEEQAKQSPSFKLRLVKYTRPLNLLLTVLIWGGSFYTIISCWQLDQIQDFSKPYLSLLGAMASSIFLTLLLAICAWEAFNYVLDKKFSNEDTADKSKRLATILPLVQRTVLIVISIVAGLTILSELGVNIAPLLAGASIFGVAIGFGSQSLVKDVITGLFMLVENTIDVGDIADLGNGNVGSVEAISIRTVRLRDATGTVHTIPFSSISRIKNLSRTFNFHVFTMGVAYEENVDHVIATLKEIGQELRSLESVKDTILEDMEILGLDTFGDSSVNIKGKIKTTPGGQFKVGRELNRLIKNTFDEKGISIPFPCRTVYLQKEA